MKISELEYELERLKAELEKKDSELQLLMQKLKELEADFNDERRAMLYMLEDINDASTKMEAAKKDWLATFDAISDPIFIHDEQLRIVRANRAYEMAAGVPIEEIIGKPYYEIFPRMDGPHRMCLKALSLQEEEEEVTLPSIDKIFKVRFYPMMKIEEKETSYIHLMEDITEARRSEEKLKEEMTITSNLLMLAETIARITDIDKLMKEVSHYCSKITGCDICLLYLWDKEATAFIPSQEFGLPHELIPLFRTEQLNMEEEFVKKIFEKNEPLLVEFKSSEWFKPFEWIKDINTMSIAPLIGMEDYLGFIVCIFMGKDLKPVPKSAEKTIRIMKGISYQVTIALEEARLYRESIDRAMELSHKIETIKVMHEIDKNILSTLRSEEILETAIRMVSKVIACDRATIALADKDRQEFIYAAGFGVTSISKGAFVPFGDTNATEVIKTRRPQYVSNLMDIKLLLPFEKKLLQEGFLSHIRVPLTVKDEVVGVLNIGTKRASAFTREALSALENLASQISVALSNARLITDLEELFMGTVKSLSNAIDAKSKWTAGHSERVTEYAINIGKEMGLSEKELKNLELAGLLHDIGKIGTYESILDKPGKLTNEEFEIMKKHPVHGTEILQDIKQLKDIIPFIRHHHERIDGKGYPDGLEGEDIPLSARILHVADTFDAIMADRPYRPSPGIEHAKSEFKKFAGTQFDPRVAEAFLRVLERK